LLDPRGRKRADALVEGGGETVFTLSTIEARASRIRGRVGKSNPNTPIGLLERQIAMLHCHLEETQNLRGKHLAAILHAEVKAGTDLLNWKERNPTDLHSWQLRGDSIKARLNQIGTERRHTQAGFAIEIRGLHERLMLALNDLDHLRQ